MNNLIQNVIEWARTRNLLDNDPKAQYIKLQEEAGELARAILKNDTLEQKDSIGDMLVVLIILAKQLNTSVEECLEIAWNEIKDRKGTTVDGVFIKEEK